MYLHLLFLVALVQFGESQNGGGRSITLNSCHCLIPADQCATKDEVREVIREVESVQADIQSLTTIVADIQTNMQQLLQTLNPDSTEETPTTEPLYNCSGTPGWKRVVFIDMTDTSYNCPPGLKLISNPKRTCGRAHTGAGECSSTTFSVGGSEYSRVCGRIRGYQVGHTVSFLGYNTNSHLLNGQYVDGVSLTHGPDGGRQHIWTFASGIKEGFSSLNNLCPCDQTYFGSPPFVGDDYFCESGSDRAGSFRGVFFPDDPLWDGQGCSSTSECCQRNNPPWFKKNLPNPTTDDIELRLCLHSYPHDSDVPLELIELYVK